MIDLIGVPFDYCGFRLGSRLGPAAVRLAGLGTTLDRVGVSLNDLGDVAVQPEVTAPNGLKNYVPAAAMYRELSHRVADSIAGGRTPLVVGGDHSLSIGSVAGALRATSGDLAVLWIDAHTDINTPDTSPSGNLHGMPLAALIGMPSVRTDRAGEEWRDLLDGVIGGPKLQPERVGWFAIRDVDDGEKDAFAQLNEGYVATMYDIDRNGVVEMLLRIDKWLRDSGVKNLWISFDVDSLDPILAPGTGTAVRGGLSYREMHVTGELFHEMLSAPDCPYRLVGLDLVETNPLFDTNNETARTAVEWIASLFGKTILGSR